MLISSKDNNVLLNETDYLLSNSRNRQMLERSMKNISRGKTHQFASLDDLKKALVDFF